MDSLAKKLEKLADKVDEKEAQRKTMFSSGGGVETRRDKLSPCPAQLQTNEDF